MDRRPNAVALNCTPREGAERHDARRTVEWAAASDLTRNEACGPGNATNEFITNRLEHEELADELDYSIDN